MAEDAKYFVKIDGPDAIMAVSGRAGYLNCGKAGEFFNAAADRECKTLSIDLGECSGLDSTFLGMIAGAALRLRKTGGSVRLLNASGRIMQLAENLGICRLVSVAAAEAPAPAENIGAANASKLDILAAHENLSAADEGNRKKFEDVVSFLRRELKR